VKNVLRIRHCASWSDKPLTKGKMVQKFNPKIFTDILSVVNHDFSKKIMGDSLYVTYYMYLIIGITTLFSHY